MLNFIKEEYGDMPIWITENGNEQQAIYDDFEKVFSLKGYMNEVLKGKCHYHNFVLFIM